MFSCDIHSAQTKLTTESNPTTLKIGNTTSSGTKANSCWASCTIPYPSTGFFKLFFKANKFNFTQYPHYRMTSWTNTLCMLIYFQKNIKHTVIIFLVILIVNNIFSTLYSFIISHQLKTQSAGPYEWLVMCGTYVNQYQISFKIF